MALAIGLLTVALLAPPAGAHVDPPGATATGTTQTLGVFADAACTIPKAKLKSADGTARYVVKTHETFYLQAALSWAGGAAASFEMGRWRLEAAGVEIADITPGVVPCLGDPGTSVDDPGFPGGRGACAGTPGTIVSSCEPYTSTAADDLAGTIFFEALLGDFNPASPDTSFAHLAVNDLAGVSSSIPQVVAIAPCGDGNLDMGEECDDGNLTPGDGCDAMCQLEPFCGDGTVDPGETCDDGNMTPGDGCDAMCQTEVPTLTEWAGISLALALLALGALMIRHRTRRV